MFPDEICLFDVRQTSVTIYLWRALEISKRTWTKWNCKWRQTISNRATSVIVGALDGGSEAEGSEKELGSDRIGFTCTANIYGRLPLSWWFAAFVVAVVPGAVLLGSIGQVAGCNWVASPRQVPGSINQHRNVLLVRHLSDRIYRRNSSKLMWNIDLGTAIATYIPAMRRQRAARIINVAIHIFQ